MAFPFLYMTLAVNKLNSHGVVMPKKTKVIQYYLQNHFKSSKYSIWPFYFAINELPIHKHRCGDYLLLAGLWFGYQKLNMLTFLKPFFNSLSTMHAGVAMHSPDITDSFKCHAGLLCDTCDLRAKAMVLNMMQFNGQCGCTHCTQHGEQFSTGERETVHVCVSLHPE